MNYHVIFSPEAIEQLAALYNYIADVAEPDIATRYVEAIVGYCESLCTFPMRGTMRDDVRPSLRITNYKKRTVIAFEVNTKAEQVSIIGLFYGGQDYEAILQDELAITQAQAAFTGAAQDFGVENDEDVQKLVDEIRYENKSS